MKAHEVANPMRAGQRRLLLGCLLAGLFLLAALAAAAITRLPARTNGHAAPPALTLGGQPLALALDPRTGRVFVLSDLTSGIATDSSATSSMTMIDPRSGRVLHSAALYSNPSSIVLDARTGRLFASDSEYDTISVFDARTGAMVRTVAIGIGALAANDAQPIAVDERTNRVFVSQLRATDVLDARSGALRAQVPGDGGSLLVDQRTARVFALGDSRVLVLDARDGTLLRTTALPGTPADGVVDERAQRVFLTGATGVSALDARSGRLVYTVRGTTDSLVVGDHTRRVFVSGPSGVSMLDARNGHVIRRIGGDDRLAIDHHTDRVFVAGSQWVRVLDARSGRVLRSVPLAQPSDGLAVDERGGRVFVLTASPYDATGLRSATGNLVVLDARRGSVPRTFALEGTPERVAVDDHTGCAIVLTVGGIVPVNDRWAWLPPLVRRLPLLPTPGPPVRVVPGHVYMACCAKGRAC